MNDQFDVICLSHLRWDFVYQRPQHLMSRFGRQGRVFFVEEPVGSGGDSIEVSERGDNIFICRPQGGDDSLIADHISEMCSRYYIENYITWFYTPMMLGWAAKLKPRAVVYDCMDQLSAFRGAPPELLGREQELFAKADLVFTGGKSLYEAKRGQHHAVYAFPSSIETEHFGKARSISVDVEDQAGIPHPRVGFAGVIDERSDLQLLDAIAKARPEWSFIMVGPVVKIDENDLPRPANIYYFGQKSYDDLPAILAGWDVAMMPFALNESTRYISPTKTPEYLAAGLGVVSTAIADVISLYGEEGLVHIAATPEEFVAALDRALAEDRPTRLQKADEFLKNVSWDKTFLSMWELVEEAIKGNDAQAVAAGAEPTAEARAARVEAA